MVSKVVAKFKQNIQEEACYSDDRPNLISQGRWTICDTSDAQDKWVHLVLVKIQEIYDVPVTF